MADNPKKVQLQPKEMKSVVLPWDRRLRFWPNYHSNSAPDKNTQENVTLLKNGDTKSVEVDGTTTDADKGESTNNGTNILEEDKVKSSRDVVELDKMFKLQESVLDERIRKMKEKLTKTSGAVGVTISNQCIMQNYKAGAQISELKIRPAPRSPSYIYQSARIATEPDPAQIKVCNNTSDDQEMADTENEVEDLSTYYVAMYAKPSTRKHKTMEDDGYLIVSGKRVVLKDSNGEVVESANSYKLTEEMLTEQKIFKLGGKEVQIQELAPKNPFGRGSRQQSNTDDQTYKVTEPSKNNSFKGDSNRDYPSAFKQPKNLEPAPNKIHLMKDDNTSADDGESTTSDENSSKYFVVMFAKPSSRKRKVMEDDGYLIVSGKTVVLKNSSGEVMGSSKNFKLTEEMLTEQKIFHLAGKEVQILEQTLDNPFVKDKNTLGNPQLDETVEPTYKRLKEDTSSQQVSTSSRASEAPSSCSRIKNHKDTESSDDENPTHSSLVEPQQDVINESKCYAAMYAKPSTRKHKVMEHDGFIIVSGTCVVLKSSEGDVMERSKNYKLTQEMIEDQKFFKLGGKEVQIVEPIENPFGEDSTSTNSYRWNP